jgi:hypothetical protein
MKYRPPLYLIVLSVIASSSPAPAAAIATSATDASTLSACGITRTFPIPCLDPANTLTERAIEHTRLANDMPAKKGGRTGGQGGSWSNGGGPVWGLEGPTMGQVGGIINSTFPPNPSLFAQPPTPSRPPPNSTYSPYGPQTFPTYSPYGPTGNY